MEVTSLLEQLLDQLLRLLRALQSGEADLLQGLFLRELRNGRRDVGVLDVVDRVLQVGLLGGCDLRAGVQFVDRRTDRAGVGNTRI